MERNSLKHTGWLVVIVWAGLLGMYFLPDLAVRGHALRRVDMLSDVRPPEAELPSSEQESADRDSVPRQLVTALPCPPGATCIEDYGDSTLRGMVRFYQALDSNVVKSRPVRIAYFGDSFIEADILTADLREMLQKEYGGCGVGFVNITSKTSGFRPTVHHFFRGWESHCVMDDTAHFEPKKQGISGHYFVPQTGAYVELRGGKGYASRLDTCQRASIFFCGRGSTTLSVRVNRGGKQTRTFAPADGLQEMVVEGDIGAVRWTVERADSTLFYGLAMDGKSGIILDNFSLRGSTGLTLRSVPLQTMREFNDLRPYDLILLQYGLNVATERGRNYDRYIAGMRTTVQRLKEAFPQAGILVVSVGDRDYKTDEGDLRTMPGIKNLVRSQQEMAADEAVAFWNLFEAMGGDDSMVDLVHSKPSLANHDYAHINFRGGKRLAGLLLEALLYGKEQFDRKECFVPDSLTLAPVPLAKDTSALARRPLFEKVRTSLTYDPQKPMLFGSGLFLWLFTAFVLVYLMLQRLTTARLLFVTLFSYYFYYKSSGTYFYLLAIVTLCDFLLARLMARASATWLRRLWLVMSLVVDLGLLGYFKYTNFFGEVYASVTGGTFTAMDIFLPVGISFFTFQSMSYTIDVYRRQITPLRNLLDYAFYVSFFPQLVAGPIVRARDFIPQIRQPLFVSHEMFGRGVFLIMSGLFKKAVVSDYISINFVDRVFDNPALYSGVECLMAVYGYALQIYCDFSGYSDMAIGIALLLGFRFADNFRSPYKSASVTEFWRRWHISLSGWLRDYLYISLGGNRKGRFRQYLNLIVTMFLGGLWHGASWNFVLWGALHGVALAFHKAWMTLTGRKKGEERHGIRRFFGIVVTFHFVCFCWIFFRHTDFSAALTMLRQISFDFRPELLLPLITGYKEVFALIAVGYLLHFLPDSWERGCTRAVVRLPLLTKAMLMILVIYIVIQMKGTEIQPFIYFQF